MKNFRPALERVTPHLGLPFRGHDPQFHAVLFRLDRVQFARAEDDEITRHRGRWGETDFLAAAGFLPAGVTAPGYRRLLFHRHVGDGEEVLRHDRRELEFGAETRLIPAGKHPARIRRLELGPEHDLLLVRPEFLVTGKEKSLPLGIDFPAELERHFVRARHQLVRQGQGQRLRLRVQDDRFFRQRLAVDRGRRDLQLERVQDELGDRFFDRDADGLGAGESQLLEIGNDADGVLGRPDFFR